ncbi:MAG: heat-inducible transcriptional repressor HrcA, partial [Oscillospiraceae bacterium]
DISKRKKVILAKIIALHTESGDPVGSKILANMLEDFSVSSATLRNEMAQLTSMGLLEQPHTSAGRVPTELGYRFFVDNLMDLFEPQSSDKKRISNAVEEMDSDPDKAAESAASALARMTGLAAVASTPRSRDATVAHFELMKVGRYNMAILGVTSVGGVKTRMCRLAVELGSTEIAALEAVLNDHFAFVSKEDISPRLIANVNALLDERRGEYTPIISAVVALIGGVRDVRVYTEGQNNLLRFHELDGCIKELLGLMNDTGELERLLSQSEQIKILVGTELGNGEFENAAMIIGNYRFSGGLRGGLGIVGPARMNYGFLVPRLKYMCDCLSHALVNPVN